MVAAHCDAGSANCRFVIRPNCSLTWRGAVTFYIGVCLVSLTIAGLFTAQGAWPILPFAGLELLALGAALYLVAWRAATREVISIGEDSVQVSRGRTAPVESRRFARPWVHVVLDPPRWYGHPCRVWIRGGGKELEVGRCLTDGERRMLANQLGHQLTRSG